MTNLRPIALAALLATLIGCGSTAEPEGGDGPSGEGGHGGEDAGRDADRSGDAARADGRGGRDAHDAAKDADRTADAAEDAPPDARADAGDATVPDVPADLPPDADDASDVEGTASDASPFDAEDADEDASDTANGDTTDAAPDTSGDAANDASSCADPSHEGTWTGSWAGNFGSTELPPLPFVEAQGQHTLTIVCVDAVYAVQGSIEPDRPEHSTSGNYRGTFDPDTGAVEAEFQLVVEGSDHLYFGPWTGLLADGVFDGTFRSSSAQADGDWSTD